MGHLDGGKKISVTLRSKRESACFEARPGERLLFAGLRNGFALPYECASGSCASCQAQPIEPLSGALHNQFPDARAGATLRPGRILMCQTTCHHDVELQVFARIGKLSEHEVRPEYLAGTIVSIDEIAANTIAFAIRMSEPASYTAGQFAMLSVDGVPGMRAYSMTNAPDRQGNWDFVIRTVPNGHFSSWIRGGRRVGEGVRLFGPLGRAVLPADEGKHVVAIVGGTGIAGIIAIIDAALTRGYFENRTFTLVFGVKKMEEAFFLDRLSAAVVASDGRLNVVLALSGDGGAPLIAHQNIAVARGLAVDVGLSVLCDRLDHRELSYFLAGPPIVVESGLSMLQERFNVDPRAVRYDRFE